MLGKNCADASVGLPCLAAPSHRVTVFDQCPLSQVAQGQPVDSNLLLLLQRHCECTGWCHPGQEQFTHGNLSATFPGQTFRSVTSFSCQDNWELPDSKKVLTELPCSNLCELYLEDCAMQLRPSSAHQGILQASTGLTNLQLQLSHLTDSADGLACMTALSALPAL